MNNSPEGAPGSANSGTPQTDAKCRDYSGPLCSIGSVQFIPADFARRLERELTAATEEVERLQQEVERWSRLAKGNAAACNTIEDERFSLWEENKVLRAQLAQLTGAQDRMDAEIAMLTADLFRATSERDQARQDLEERCAENDRERAAHLQAYQAAVKERDAAIANHIAAQSKLNAVERERDALQALRDEDRQLWTQKIDEVVSEKRTAVELVRLLDERNGLLHQLRSILRQAGFPDRIKMGEDFHGNEDWAPVRVECQLKDALARLTAAESELAELRKDRERGASDSRLVWRSNKFLREAFIETINGLKEKLNTRYYTLFDKPQQSSAHLSWMLSELERHLDDFPADKTGRWIGYVQGCLACNDLLNVDEERDRTRPLFRKAYAIDAARNQQENRE